MAQQRSQTQGRKVESTRTALNAAASNFRTSIISQGFSKDGNHGPTYHRVAALEKPPPQKEKKINQPQADGFGAIQVLVVGVFHTTPGKCNRRKES